MAALIVAKQRLVFFFCAVLFKNSGTTQSKSLVPKPNVVRNLTGYRALFLPFAFQLKSSLLKRAFVVFSLKKLMERFKTV